MSRWGGHRCKAARGAAELVGKRIVPAGIQHHDLDLAGGAIHCLQEGIDVNRLKPHFVFVLDGGIHRDEIVLALTCTPWPE